ncbi:hypothetical protein B7486_70815, partial [cyanobacterium TDX16]
MPRSLPQPEIVRSGGRRCRARGRYHDLGALATVAGRRGHTVEHQGIETMAGPKPLDRVRARATTRRAAAAVLLLLTSLGVVALGSSPAGAALACQVDERLLDDVLTSSILDPAASDDAAWIAFSSGEDLTGDNPDGELQVFLLQRSTGALEQITDVEDNGGFQYAGDTSI